jgi:acetate---CoA ligase (ADP-forming)
MRGIMITQPTDDTLTRLKAAGIDIKPARLVDLTLTGTRYDVMKAALDILATAPEFDLILCVVGSSARFYPELAVRPIVDSVGAKKPIAAFLTPDAPQALAMLSRAGVPSFHTPEACADAIAAALRRRVPMAQQDVDAREHKRVHARLRRAMRGHDERPRLIDELAAYELLKKHGLTCAPSLALDANLTAAPPLPFPYPVVVKALCAELTHKSDAGGVMLNVADGAALITACRRIRENVAARGLAITRVLVQPMISGIGEVLIGYRVDPDVGPLIMVAMGGLFTEIYRDRSLRLAPVDLVAAQEMIAEVRGLLTLSGFRGKSKGDLAALAQAVVALSRLADDPTVIEAEINPLIVGAAGEGVVAVDAVVRIA